MQLLEAGSIPYRDGEQMRYVMDGSRAKLKLGWQSEVPLDDGNALTQAAGHAASRIGAHLALRSLR